MLAPLHIINQIADCFAWADRLTRADLIHGFIVDENDYTSNFTGAARREINARNIPQISAHSQTISQSLERAAGVDACIILANKNHYKIGLFEAKWPRASKSYKWDYIQTSSQTSHFDSQILRQHRYAPQMAIWEMFYYEAPFQSSSHLFPSYGSACIWHEHAYNTTQARNNKNEWSTHELEHSLLSHHTNDIHTIIKDICSCYKGEVISNEVHYEDLLEEIGFSGEVLLVNISLD